MIEPNQMSKFLSLGMLSFFVATLVSCGEKKQQTAEPIHFTQEDSLTDRYLVLQDSLLHAWNLMMNDDNQKIKAMKYLLHELSVGKQIEETKLKMLDHRLDQLTRIRFTQKTMVNPDVVEEYDFASNALVTELIAITVAAPNYEQNTALQNLAEGISVADQRIAIYRTEYDVIAKQYNEFLLNNKSFVKSIDRNSSLEKKPLFDMLAEE